MTPNIAIILEQKFDPSAGGVQQSTSKLAEIFKKNKHKVIIISVANADKSSEQWNFINLYYTGKNIAKEMGEILNSNQIDIVINQAGYNVGLTKLAKKVMPENAVLINTLRINPLNFVQNYEVYIAAFLNEKRLNFFNNKLTKFLILKYHYLKQNNEYEQLLKTTDSLVLLSDSFKEEIFQLCKKAKSFQHKITAIPNPFKSSNYIYNTDLKQNVILFVGRLVIVQKRVDILLNLWKNMHDKLPNWEFWIVGYGEEEHHMKKYCENNGLNRVKFFGKDNPEKYYRKAKIFHFTSAFEGFGNVLVEAQQYGCVPIMFDSYAAAKDIVIDNKSGFLIEPFDESKFEIKTFSLIENHKLLETMGIAAIENVHKFSFENTYNLWNKLFNDLMSLKK
jgi:glycosyltransferase involved in cell wall biosynthesis